MKKYLLIITCIPFWIPASSADAQSGSATTQVGTPGFFSGAGTFGGGGIGSSSLPGISWRSSAGEGEGAVSIVVFKSPDQKTLDEIAEDLNILSLVFSQNLERALGVEGGESGNFKLGIPILLQTGGKSVEASYIEGFGAVFRLKVRFPLVQAPASDKNAPANPAESEWEQARRALAGGAQDPFGGAAPFEDQGRYNPKLVDTLKRRVIELLKNASNLRHVQPDESVAVTVAGPPDAPNSPPSQSPNQPAAGVAWMEGQPVKESSSGATPQAAGPMYGIPGAAQKPLSTSPAATDHMTLTAELPVQKGQPAAPRTPDRVTVMTIRIRKSDADAYAANKMSDEQFFHAAEVTTYLGPVVARDWAGNVLGYRIR